LGLVDKAKPSQAGTPTRAIQASMIQSTYCHWILANTGPAYSRAMVAKQSAADDATCRLFACNTQTHLDTNAHSEPGCISRRSASNKWLSLYSSANQ